MHHRAAGAAAASGLPTARCSVEGTGSEGTGQCECGCGEAGGGIGARTVRGNHDFEVVRWWEARMREEKQAMVSMEHARIARGLSAHEHAWLVDSPWFIECAEMGHLFVHADFIPGVKLTQQNPRLMMNMRNVLGDGTVTVKNVADCEWAKLWKGPQTVVFGYDALRGLQQYDYATGIDTGCVYGGRMTALLLSHISISDAASTIVLSVDKDVRESVYCSAFRSCAILLS